MKVLLILLLSVFASLAQAGNRIVVSISEQSAWLLDADNKVLMESPVATGLHHNTPTGHFTIGEKDLVHHSSINYSWVMRYYMHLANEPFGLHQYYIPWISPDGKHGRPASHGCVRMPMAQAIYFYNRVEVGTPVDIIP
jgi:lipoprotein-anchoring transpeptidase ErfK/SrfK